MKSTHVPDPSGPGGKSAPAHTSRRNFLRYAGATGVMATVLAACHKGDLPNPPGKHHSNGKTVDLGSGDIGILNYAYALEQLEAAFYTKIIDHPYDLITPTEFNLFTDIRDHEIAHREFFKKALGAKAIVGLTPDFSSINFYNRQAVLAAAKSFEDLGVSAYNGAGSLITSADYLTLAGKIVSVEARHAAYIRDLISNGSFADSTVVDASGMDTSRMPKEVLSKASVYIREDLDASHLPTS